MAKKEAPVLQRMYLFLQWLIRRVNHFPRSQRFILGDRIENSALDIQRLLVQAVFSRQKKDILRQANLELEQLRWLLRLAHDEKLLTRDQYYFAADCLHEIGRQVGGWQKQASRTP